MLKNYLKIAWKVLLRRKFFTFISLFGISFTLMVLMVATSLFDYAFGPQMPERETDRLLFVNTMREQIEGGYTSSGPFCYHFLSRNVRTLQTPEMVSINSVFTTVNSYVNNRKLVLDLKYTDQEFWDILDFNFRLCSRMYDVGISMAARVFIGSYVRDNYPGKLPLLP
ncbi:ABC transporter permease, partial [Pontibacter brevis]